MITVGRPSECEEEREQSRPPHVAVGVLVEVHEVEVSRHAKAQRQ